MAALTKTELERALQMRIDGKSYTDIAAALDYSNTDTFRRQILEYQKESSAVVTANLESVFALDLARLEMMVEKNLELAKDGSEKHVSAVIRILRAKMDHAKFMMDLMAANAEETDDYTATISTSDEEYLLAAENINEEILEGIYDDDDLPEPDLEFNGLTEEERKMLETQLAELELTQMLDED